MVENPYYLVIATETDGIRIDLDEHKWMKTHKDWLRRPGMWILMRKADDAQVLMVFVRPGDQPFYTAHHVGMTSSAGGREITTFGIGKKRRGRREVMWVMPNGAICAGDDVDDIGVRVVRALGPIPTEPEG